MEPDNCGRPYDTSFLDEEDFSDSDSHGGASLKEPADRATQESEKSELGSSSSDLEVKLRCTKYSSFGPAWSWLDVPYGSPPLFPPPDLTRSPSLNIDESDCVLTPSEGRSDVFTVCSTISDGSILNFEKANPHCLESGSTASSPIYELLDDDDEVEVAGGLMVKEVRELLGRARVALDSSERYKGKFDDSVWDVTANRIMDARHMLRRKGFKPQDFWTRTAIIFKRHQENFIRNMDLLFIELRAEEEHHRSIGPLRSRETPPVKVAVVASAKLASEEALPAVPEGKKEHGVPAFSGQLDHVERTRERLQGLRHCQRERHPGIR
ncbi:hypothetical protein QBC46DRAFT_356652 [Diplogelasinospora grovesii]|uniref:Uncharacterized protein n=1 Tax=Diplogelasinospora grovesii TaxID=303347 RepID=A0AAN6N1Q1_9PEZI|nr:hypothetical protein QBC46DRAFT_356652 [Diplogelasinospora grovesii]